jgi:hypothetical protein
MKLMIETCWCLHNLLSAMLCMKAQGLYLSGQTFTFYLFTVKKLISFFLGFVMTFSFYITQVLSNSTVTGALLLLSQRVLLHFVTDSDREQRNQHALTVYQRGKEVQISLMIRWRRQRSTTYTSVLCLGHQIKCSFPMPQRKIPSTLKK